MTDGEKKLYDRLKEVAEDLHTLRGAAAVLGTTEIMAQLAKLDDRVRAVLAPVEAVE